MACCSDATFSDRTSEPCRDWATRAAVALRVASSAYWIFELDIALSLASPKDTVAGVTADEVIELIICCGLPMPSTKLMMYLHLLECIGSESKYFSTLVCSFWNFLMLQFDLRDDLFGDTKSTYFGDSLGKSLRPEASDGVRGTIVALLFIVCRPTVLFCPHWFQHLLQHHRLKLPSGINQFGLLLYVKIRVNL